MFHSTLNTEILQEVWSTNKISCLTKRVLKQVGRAQAFKNILVAKNWSRRIFIMVKGDKLAENILFLFLLIFSLILFNLFYIVVIFIILLNVAFNIFIFGIFVVVIFLLLFLFSLPFFVSLFFVFCLICVGWISFYYYYYFN